MVGYSRAKAWRQSRAQASSQRAVKELGGYIAWDWPKGCWLWAHTKVVAIMEGFALDCALFDGCAFGLTAASGKNKRRPIRKPWAICSDSQSIVQSFRGPPVPWLYSTSDSRHLPTQRH